MVGAILACYPHHAPALYCSLVSAHSCRHGSHAEALDDGEPWDKAKQQHRVMGSLHRGEGGQRRQHCMTARACTDLVACPFFLVLLLLQAWQAPARCGRPVLTRESRHGRGMRMASTDTKQVVQDSASHPGGQCWQV